MKKERIKIFLGVILFLVVVALIFLVIRIGFSIEKNETEYDNYYHSLKYYEINITGTIDDDNIDINNFEGINEYSRSTEGFDRKDNKFSDYNRLGSGEYRYYIDNQMLYADNIDSKEHYYFCENDTGEIDFYYKLTSDYRRSDWYIRKDYIIPTVLTDNIESVMIVATSSVVSKNTYEIPRVNTENVIMVTDKNTINKCLDAYKNQEKSLTFLKDEVNASFIGNYIVLAKFDNAVIYQFLGNL